MKAYKLDIKQDIVFQFVLGQNTEKSNALLKGLIETFLPFKIKSLKVLNPRVREGYLGEKQTVMDVLCQLNDGKYVQVEMQMNDMQGGLFTRLEYYNSQLLHSQEMKGKDYRKLEACYTIMIMNFKCINDDDLIHDFAMRDRKGKYMNIDHKLNVTVVELPKCKEGSSDSAEQLSYYLRYYADEKKRDIMKSLVKDNALCAMVEDRMNEISETQREKLEQMLHEKYLNDEATRKAIMIDDAKEEGKDETRIEMILKMGEKLSSLEIASLLDMDITEVETIINK